MYQTQDFIHQPAVEYDAPLSVSYRGPNGKTLTRRADDIRANSKAYRVYRASCRDRSLKGNCTKKRARHIKVSVHREIIKETRLRLDKTLSTTKKRASRPEECSTCERK